MVRDRTRLRRDDGPWYAEMQSLGFNYRMTDIQCALGRSQLRKLPEFLADVGSSQMSTTAISRRSRVWTCPVRRDDVESAWHLYVVRVPASVRRRFFEALRECGIGVQVHYLPVYLHPYYQDLGYRGRCCVRRRRSSTPARSRSRSFPDSRMTTCPAWSRR